MSTLSISEFSCLHDAVLTLAPVNVIIGPQGSGKSVTTKLHYFCADITTNFLQSAERGDSLDDYKRFLARQFNIWFPASAWGQGRFKIGYSAGQFSVRILRRLSQGRVSDNVAITFSEWFVEIYAQALALFDRSRPGDDAELASNSPVNFALDRMWKVRETVSKRIENDLRDDYLPQQTFIPAGRAFFTSIGRLVAGFEQAGSLDPITLKFARLFANIRDRNSARFASRFNRLGDDFLARRNLFMTKLFGGEVKFEDEAEFVEAPDGRKIPFSSLSSGQQELLPMWSLMDYFSELDALRSTSPQRTRNTYRELVYIEEPEAHLFPSAQSLLMEFLIGSIVSERRRRSLVITTHSPYIMAKLNVFLKAGRLARRRRKNQEINDVVPRDCWLNDSQLSAFAIEDGTMRSLLDADGLIDGTYLDQISEDISRDFSRLLLIESEL